MNDEQEPLATEPFLEEPGEEDFSTLLGESLNRMGRGKTQDVRVTGTVVSMNSEWVFVDYGAKSEGFIARKEFQNEDGSLNVAVGDRITAYILKREAGETLLSTKMTAASSQEDLMEAFRSGLPVEGLVSGLQKAGYQISLFGKKAFCPFSQMDLRSVAHPEELVGKRLGFKVTEYSEGGRNIVVSRRQILEEERTTTLRRLKETLKQGDSVTGTVKNLASYGAFVEIAPGVEGLIPIAELAWHPVSGPSEVLTIGQEVTLRVMGLDWEKGRISLSLKHMSQNPWESVGARFSEDSVVQGKVRRLAPFGAFVEIEPGIEGLLHVSQLGLGRRVLHPGEVLSEGQEIEVRIVSMDTEARRIGLEMSYGSDEEDKKTQDLRPGTAVQGIVESVKPYGVFVRLAGKKTGLLHVSEMVGASGQDLKRRFPIGSEIQVQILSMNPDTGKISLSTQKIKEELEAQEMKAYMGQAQGPRSLGTLGDTLKQKRR